MNKDQYDQFNAAPHATNLLGIQELMNRAPRTLIFGYTLDRDTFHVYLGEDDLIHVLIYSELSAPDEPDNGRPRFLVLSHTFGETGGVERNDEYTPKKRVYPESCDYEFCQALRRYDVNIPFTTFTEGADEHRLTRFQGFAGYTLAHDGGCEVVSLYEKLVEHPLFPKGGDAPAYQLASRLAAQAARELAVPYASSGDGSSTTVEKSRAHEVLARAQQYLLDLNGAYLSKDVAKHLAEEALGAFHQFWIGSSHFMGGTFSAVVEIEHIDFVEDSSFVQYVGKPGGYYEKGILGSYNGRPFFACKTEKQTHLAYSQFGDTERFLKEQLRQFSLVPVAVAA